MADGLRLAAVPVPADDAVRAALSRRWLSADEAGCCGRRAVAKRRAEFTAGRIAAKLSVARLLGVEATRDSVRVVVDAYECAGRPRARYVPHDEPVEISITHVDGLAIAAAARTRLGIDLTGIEAQPDAFVREAFVPGELDAWRATLGWRCQHGLAEAVAFAAKEAALKWLGSGLRHGLHLSRVIPRSLAPDESISDLGATGRRLVVLFGVRSGASAPWNETELHGWLIALDRHVLIVLRGTER